MRKDEDLKAVAEIFETFRPRLSHYLTSAFPSLADDVDDILQNLWLEIQRRMVHEGFDPGDKWESWLRVMARSRALDRLRSIERRIFCSWPRTGSGDESQASWTPSNPSGASPSAEALEKERRQRQGLLLSDVLAEFCRWCEKRPERSAVKEAYERSLRGQTPAEIAQAMSLPSQLVYQYLHQAREWVRTRILEKDVDRSVFLTLYRAQ